MPQHIVITGGSSGLGLALAKRLAARGAALALIARDAHKLDQAAKEIRDLFPEAHVLTWSVDVQNPAQLNAAFNDIAVALGGIDVLINSAGILREGHFDELALDDHHTVMNINYFGVLNTIRAALPHLASSRRPRIINIASIAGLTGVFGYTAYCASKHALVGLTESLRYELEPRGITVQLVCPGEFESPMVDKLDLQRSPENQAHAQTIPRVEVEIVVREILQAMTTQDYLIIPGRLAKLSAFGLRHFPAVSRTLGKLRIRRASRA